MTNRDFSSLTHINIGCGNDIRENCVNLDSAALSTYKPSFVLHI
jgi:hypothetical protein